MATERAELEAFYRRYLQRCNEHRFDELDEFVDEHVEVNGVVQGLRGYAEGLGAVVEAVPDYHWDLRRLLVDRSWLSAHLIDTGTTSAGRPISIQEFAMYRVADGRIVGDHGRQPTCATHRRSWSGRRSGKAGAWPPSAARWPITLPGDRVKSDAKPAPHLSY
jgi:predicted ester cyclase